MQAVLPILMIGLDLAFDLRRRCVAKTHAEEVQRCAQLRWLKEGRLMEIAEYCCFDVKITKELHEYGKTNGEVFHNDRFGQKRNVKVKW